MRRSRKYAFGCARAASPGSFAGSGIPAGLRSAPGSPACARNRARFSKLNQLTGKQQKEVRERVLNDLIARYPRELQPHIQLMDSARWDDRDALPALQARYKKEAAEYPDDPVALFLAAQALYRTDTPEAIRLAEKARRIAPQFARPALLLADIYADGKFKDKEKATRNLATYLEVCPTTVGPARWAMSKVGTPEMRAKVARDLRAKLSGETNPIALRDYETWGFEFRTHPPAEHDALRRQVADDVKRLEKVNPKPDSAYFDVLRKGYKQSGATRRRCRRSKIESCARCRRAASLTRLRTSAGRRSTKNPRTRRTPRPGRRTVRCTVLP